MNDHPRREPRRGAARPGLWVACVALIALVACKDSVLRSGPVPRALEGEATFVDPCPGYEVSELLGKLYINEIMIVNESAHPDETGAFVAWVEIYNASASEIDLGGVALSDTLSDVNKWVIPCVEDARIAAGGYFIVYLDGDTTNPDDFHASFIPNMTGQTDFVLNGGSDLVHVDLALFGPDISFGRVPDGGSFFGELLSPSPLTGNCPSLPCSVEPVEVEFIRGDVNSDGVVDSLDLDQLLLYVFEDAMLPDCLDPLDVNDDGFIGIADADRLALALGGAATIPGPYPNPGTDPTGTDPFICTLTLEGTKGETP
ncbi:MAG: lamin tail domain-containing protein [Planctomycetes bacterium]|nr:lamin tail domain-containing protein [Planctomycetota bacterium]